MPSDPIDATVLWPDPDTGPWAVRVWWRVQHGVPVPVGIAITSWSYDEDDDGPDARLPRPWTEQALPTLEGRVLRGLPFAEISRLTRELAAERMNNQAGSLALRALVAGGQSAEGQALGERFDVVNEVADALTSAPHGGRYLGDAHYQEVADVYAAALAAGERPTQAVAKHFTIQPSSAAKKVSRARELGLLPKTTRGRTGHLTEEP